MTLSKRRKSKAKEYGSYNYCVCFLDLLGQQNALNGQGVLPIVTNEEERQAFIHVVSRTIRPIIRLQQQSSMLISEITKKRHSPLRESLPPMFQREYDKINRQEVRLQYWSDGLVAFSSLGNKGPATQVNGCFALLAVAGSLCLWGLSQNLRAPLRGGIEIAWGTELRKGELYGPAIARAYDLESKCAQHPRIVVGGEMMRFLDVVEQQPDVSHEAAYSIEMAKVCKSLVTKDDDGQLIVHYLGKPFQDYISSKTHKDSYFEAIKFVEEEYERFKQAGDKKHEERYQRLLTYFKNNSVNKLDSGE